MSTLEISQLLGNYGEFVGAIAIVITLVYLTVQIRQSNQATNAASRDAAVAHVLGYFEQGMDNRVIARARHKWSSGAELDDFEREQLGDTSTTISRYLTTSIRNTNRACFQIMNGRGTEEF